MRVISVVVALMLAASAPSAQRSELDVLLPRVGAYVQRFIQQFSNVVAEERFVPDGTSSARPSLRSDYLLVHYPGTKASWLSFRDVIEANGRAARDQQQELAKLFMQPSESAVQQANAITRHSARYISPLSDPLLGVAFLQRDYQPRFRYTLGNMDRTAGPGVRRIQFDETAKPTILRRSGNRDLLSHGTAWIVEDTGRVVKTELQIGTGPSTLLTTTFKFDEGLQIDVPAQMQEAYRNPLGMLTRGSATYTRFRRFGVRTEEAIEVPSPD